MSDSFYICFAQTYRLSRFSRLKKVQQKWILAWMPCVQKNLDEKCRKFVGQICWRQKLIWIYLWIFENIYDNLLAHFWSVFEVFFFSVSDKKFVRVHFRCVWIFLESKDLVHMKGFENLLSNFFSKVPKTFVESTIYCLPVLPCAWHQMHFHASK